MQQSLNSFKGEDSPVKKLIGTIRDPVGAIGDIVFEFIHGDFMDVNIKLVLFVLGLVGFVGVASKRPVSRSFFIFLFGDLLIPFFP